MRGGAGIKGLLANASLIFSRIGNPCLQTVFPTSVTTYASTLRLLTKSVLFLASQWYVTGTPLMFTTHLLFWNFLNLTSINSLLHYLKNTNISSITCISVTNDAHKFFGFANASPWKYDHSLVTLQRDLKKGRQA